jgi:acyl-ACP thioesterase
MWAERSTTIRGSVAHVEAVALWVSLDPESGRPLTLDQGFLDVYGSAAGGRVVRARLHHPSPPAEAEATPWFFRGADLDLLGHVNNAAYWMPVEEELVRGPDPDGVTAEIEFRGGAEAGDAWVLRHGDRRWIAQPAGQVVASLQVAPH